MDLEEENMQYKLELASTDEVISTQVEKIKELESQLEAKSSELECHIKIVNGMNDLKNDVNQVKDSS